MKKNFLLPAVFAIMVYAPAVLGIWGKERLFSENENRLLTQKPVFTYDTVRKGTYGMEYEAYLADQFPGRDDWIGLKTRVQKLFGRTDINGVYFAKDGSLIEQHRPGDIDEQKAEKKAELLLVQASLFQKQVEGNVTVMLAPTADRIREDCLPLFAQDYDQEQYVTEIAERAKEEAPGVTVMDLFSVMDAHADEYLYYRTDHHWTTLGSFYAWQAYAIQTGRGQKDLRDYAKSKVSSAFLGTLYSKVNIPVDPDQIYAYISSNQLLCTVTEVSEMESGSINARGLYREDKRNGKDKYAYFLGGNFPLLKIETGSSTGKTLLLIKDSYANCMIPFLTEDYDTVYVVDPRYYRGDYTLLAGHYQVTDVLYLYNVIHFIQDYR